MNKETRILISNRINRLGCGTEILYCTRVYVNARTYGGAWIWMENILDCGFWLLWGQRSHCKASYLWEKRNAPNNKRVPQMQGGATDDSSSHLPSQASRQTE